MKKLIYILIFCILSLSSNIVWAQDDKEDNKKKEKKESKPVRPMFESAYIIDNQSVLVYPQKTLEFNIQHRFGQVNNGLSDLYGLYGVANIRMSLTYVPFENLAIGFGTTKNKKYQDLNIKYAIFQQTRSGSFPVSITYYGNVAVDARNKNNFVSSSDRVSYFHQLIFARKFSPSFSLQISPTLSHFNAVPAFEDNGVLKAEMNNDHIAVSVSGRMKVTGQGSVIFDVNQPITQHYTNNPKPNISFGFEISTSSHAFQIFMGNNWGILQQENNFFNANNPADGEFLIGFNITRLWSF